MHRRPLAAILLLIVVAVAGCGPTAVAHPPVSPSPTPTPSPSATPTPTPTPQVACADQVFAAMTLDQRIGQLFELGLAGDRLGPTEINLIQTDHIGSVWFVDRSYAGVAGIHQSGIAVSLKHFPGLGRVTGNTDFTTATDTTTTTNDPYLQSFKQGIAANADFVMVALARYTRIDPNHLAAFSPLVMTQMLRGTMGFNGVIISDDLGDTAPGAAIPPGTRAIDLLSAGGAMVRSEDSAAPPP